MNETRITAGSPDVLEIVPWESWHELAAFALLSMEISAAALWLSFLTQTGAAVSYGQAWLCLELIVCGSYGLARFGRNLHLRLSILRAALAAWVFVSLWVSFQVFHIPSMQQGLVNAVRRTVQSLSSQDLSIPVEFVLILGVLWVIWRGVTLAGRQVEHSAVKARFAVGVGWLLAYSLVSPLSVGTFAPAIFLYMFFALLAMGASRIYNLQFTRGGKRVPFNRGWIMGILLAILGVLLIAIPLSLWMIGGLSDLLGRLVSFLIQLFLILLSILMLPFILLISWLLPNFTGNLSQFPEMMRRISAILRMFQSILDAIAARLLAFLQLDLSSIMVSTKSLLLWGALIIGILLILFALRRRRVHRRRVELEEEESLPQPDLIGVIRLGVQSLRERFGFGLGGASLSRMLIEARIRRVYVLLMRLCVELGQPRPKALTPLEFLPVMAQVLPASQKDLEVITQAYLMVRYGEVPETEQALAEVDAAWQRVSQEGKSLKQTQSRLRAKGKG